MKLVCGLFVISLTFLACNAKPQRQSTFTDEGLTRIELCPSKLPKVNDTFENRNEKTKLKFAIEEQGKRSELRNRKSGRKPPIGSKTTAIGSDEEVSVAYYDAGLLSTVLDAYNNHFVLRTSPDDWWATIITTISLAIDDNAKKPQVRDFFVAHQGKKTLSVVVGPEVYGVDYEWFFDQMAGKIRENIKVEGYVDQMEPDFTTTTGINKIVSQIMLMNSVQEYFAFSMVLGCGIPYVDMKGTREDWVKLGDKIKALRKTLTPIHNHIGLNDWWDRVENIAANLLKTFDARDEKLDDELIDWWSKVITERSYGSGQSEFKGWFMVDLLNIPNAENIGNAPSGLVAVPMSITDGQLTEEAAVVAGMVGYNYYPGEKYPILEPVHGWSMLLEPKSSFRPDMEEWNKCKCPYGDNDCYADKCPEVLKEEPDLNEVE